MPAGRSDRAGNHRERKPAGRRQPAGRGFLRSTTSYGTNAYSRAAYSETSSRDFYHTIADPSMGAAEAGSWSIIQPRERIPMERSEIQAGHDRRRRGRRATVVVVGLLVAGAGLRALAMAHTIPTAVGNMPLPDDAFYYFVLARNAAAGQWPIISGDGVPTTGFQPLWGAALAALDTAAGGLGAPARISIAQALGGLSGLAAGWAVYQPTWVELSITAAALAGFVLIYLLFSKVFPIVSIWETREEPAHRPIGHGETVGVSAP